VENVKNLQDFNVYPNPNTGKFTLEIENITSEDFTLEIVNFLGQKVFEKTLNPLSSEYSVQFDLSGYSKGLYFVKLQDTNTIKTERVVIF